MSYAKITRSLERRFTLWNSLKVASLATRGCCPCLRRSAVHGEFTEAPRSIFSDVIIARHAAHILRSWLSAVRALALLSSLDPDKIGLTEFASRKPFFPRQIRSLSQVSIAQSKAVDVDTKKPTGSYLDPPESLSLTRSQARFPTSTISLHGTPQTRRTRRNSGDA